MNKDIKQTKMKGNKIKIILTILILIAIYSFMQKFPDETILVLGIGAVIIIGMWIIELENQ